MSANTTPDSPEPRRKDQLLTLREVAERLGCSTGNVYALKECGSLAVVATGAGGKGYRVTPDELERFIRERRGHPGRNVSFPERSRPGKGAQAARQGRDWF